MHEAFEHPHPHWTPVLEYHERVPMKWVQVGPGLWFVWPPRQFRTDEPDGPNIWRNDNGRNNVYEPDRPSCFASTNPQPPEFVKLEKPMRWFDDHPASWGGYSDGRTMVILGEFKIAIGRSNVHFHLARGYPGRELGFYYPHHIENPPTQPASKWASGGFGPLSTPDANERLWYYPTPDGRRWVGTFHIEPSELQFSRCETLPPPILPSESEIASEKAEIAEELETHGDLWPLSQMKRDLAQSDEFMELIREDQFAQQFRLFFLNNDVIHLQTGKRVRSTTDDDGAWILAELRCYREHWQECNNFPREGEDPAARDKIIKLFSEVGYAPLVANFDEAAHLAALQSIWETMPGKLKQNICDEQGKVSAMTLAWAMGEFWSNKGGWNVHPLPAGDEFRLQGGHLPDAIQIAKMVEEGRLSGTEK